MKKILFIIVVFIFNISFIYASSINDLYNRLYELEESKELYFGMSFEDVYEVEKKIYEIDLFIDSLYNKVNEINNEIDEYQKEIVEINEQVNNIMTFYQVFDNANGLLVMNAGVVMNNGLGLDNPYGGGIVNKGTATLSKDVKLYNNHASVAGDDIYNYEGATVTFEAVESDGSDWSLDGGVDCEHEINGWYDDSDNSRWEAHGDTLEDDHIELVDAGTYEDVLAVKAAHDKLKGIVIVKYVNSDGVEIIPSIETTDIVGKEYETNKKEFDGYTFITVEGNETGVYTEETIIVTYYYDKNIGNGDIEPPKTGIDLGNINANNNIEIILYKKEEE